MIFPGMDPYLEDPQLWPGVHASFVVYVRDHLLPVLRPRYIAAVEERVYVEGPDREVDTIEVHEPYITILDRQSGKHVVTVIEVVSPTNKYAGPGRLSYLSKQREVLGSETHLVEIDLLRTGPHVLAVPVSTARSQGTYDDLISVNRAKNSRAKFELYLRNLRQRLPRIRIPLAEGDPDVKLDLQAVLEQTYDRGYRNG
jgi:hypothetical protein